MPFSIIRNDITKVTADAIVNTANPEAAYGRGTDYAIYMAAGRDELLEARKKIGEIHTGEAVATPAFKLKAKYIIHTVGPEWVDGSHGELKDLSSCYRKSLLLAKQLGCSSIAFPLISAGVYGFPKDKALDTALKEISSFLEDDDMEVTLVVFNRTAFKLSSELVGEVRQYVDDHYVEARREEEYIFQAAENERPQRRRKAFSELLDTDLFKKSLAGSSSRPSASYAPNSSKPFSFERPDQAEPLEEKELPEIISRLGESFQERLMALIDERGLTDTEVYKRANLDRKLFSKIRCNPGYKPKKTTAIALAVALRLNLDETIDLLKRAELALSPSSKFDLIVEYCIRKGIYDIYEINAMLFDYDQPLLGC